MKTKNAEKTGHKTLWLWLAAAALLIGGAAICLSYMPWHWIGASLFGVGAVMVLYRLFAVLGRYKKKAAAVCSHILTYLLCAGVVLAVFTEFLILQGEDPAQAEAAAGADYVIVLGAGINGTEPSLMLRYRLEAALAYMEANPDAVVIVSGGQGPDEPSSEASVMKAWLVRSGGEESRILTEEKSNNTLANFVNSFELIAARNGSADGQKIAVVSSDFHMTRALWIASDLGVDADGVPAATRNVPLWVNFHIREALSVWKYILLQRGRV